MEYEKHINGCGFEIRWYPNTKAVSIFDWDYILSDMVYTKRISIWHEKDHSEIQMKSLHTHSTPKLRKLLRGNCGYKMERS